MNDHDVAIVGMSCVFPARPTLRQFWHNIVNGVDAISDIPPGRWHHGHNHRLPPDDVAFVACSRGGFLPPEFRIDLARFGVFPNLIGEGDADQFLTMHVVDEALTDAGVAADSPLRRRTDLVVGRGGYCSNRQLEVAMNTEIVPWLRELLIARFPELGREKIEAIHRELRRDLPADNPDNISTAIPNITASRAANRLDLRGAAYTVDAACASSLIAVEQLVHRLRLGLCDLGVAGGISLNQNAGFWSIFTRLGAISETGEIRPFDRRANGVVLSEGAGAVVLKRLPDAVRDGDQIYAVIKGVGSSSDGREAGLLAPTTAGQVESLRAAYRDAAVDPDTIGYLEVHGTATNVGDAAEISTIKSIFGTARTGPRARPMGSVKSMIGHALPAAGLASLIKTALMLSNKIIAPSLHCEEPHPDLEGSPFYINSTSRAWIHSPHHHPRRAGVNAFGFGGINCHVVLEEVPETNAVGDPVPQPRPIVINVDRESEIVYVSAASRADMVRELARLRLFLDSDQSGFRLQDVAFSSSAEVDLNQPCKLALLAKTTDQLGELIALCAERLANEELPAQQVEDRETIYYSESALSQHGRLALTFPPIGFPPGLYGSYPDRLLKVCLHFPDVRREYDYIEQRDEHPDDTIPTSALLVPPPTVTPAERRELRARFGIAKLAPEGEDVPMPAPDKRNLSSFGVTLSNWASWVLIRPLEIPVDMLCGQSQGDLAALCAAGATEFRHFADSYWTSMEVPLSYTAQGHLALATISEERIAPLLAEIPDVAIAIHASRDHLILGGSTAGLKELAARLKTQGIEVQNFAYPPIHTPRLTYMREHLRASVNKIVLVSPKIPTYCATSAEVFSSEPEEIRTALLDNLDKAILWRQTYRRMYEDGARIFLQSGGTVANNIDRLIVAEDRLALSVDASFRDPLTQLNHVCGALFTAGCRFHPAALHRNRDVRRLALGQPRARAAVSPTAMPLRLDPAWFDVPRASLAVESPAQDRESLPGSTGSTLAQRVQAPPVADLAEPALAAQPDAHAPTDETTYLSTEPSTPLVGNVVHFVPGQEIVTQRSLALAEDRYLADHYFIRSADFKPLTECLPVMPMAMAIEMISEVAGCLAPGLLFIGLEDVRASRWLALEDTDNLSVKARGRLIAADAATGVHAVEVAIFAEGNATPNISATALFGPHYRQDVEIGFTDFDSGDAWWFSAAEVYGEKHMFHGPMFQCVTGLGALGVTGFHAELTVPAKSGLFVSTANPLLLTDPCVIDAVSQLGGCWVLARYRDAYVLPIGAEKIEIYRDTPPPGTRVHVRVEITQSDFDNKVLKANFEVGDGEGYVWMRLVGFSYRIFNMVTEIIDARRRPECYCCSIERTLPGLPEGAVSTLLVRESFRDTPIDWLARLYLHSGEMLEFRQLADHWQRQRQWLMGRVAVKDAVRLWLSRCQPSPTGLAHPTSIVVNSDAHGRPLVESIVGYQRVPQISIAHCAKAAVAVAGDLPLGIDIEMASPSAVELWAQFTSAGEQELLAEFLRVQPEEYWATRLWCAKEAVGKAIGTGFGGRPRDFEATAVGADGQLQICHRPTGETFSVTTFRDDAMLLALTVRGPQNRAAIAMPDFAGGRASGLGRT